MPINPIMESHLRRVYTLQAYFSAEEPGSTHSPCMCWKTRTPLHHDATWCHLMSPFSA